MVLPVVLAVAGLAAITALAALLFGVTRRKLGAKAAGAMAAATWTLGAAATGAAVLIYTFTIASKSTPEAVAVAPPATPVAPPTAPTEAPDAACANPIHADGDQPRPSDILAALYGGAASVQGTVPWTPTAADLATADAKFLQINGPWEAHVSSALNIGGEFGPAWLVFAESHDPTMAGANADTALIGGVVLSREDDHYCLEASQRALLLAGYDGAVPTPTPFPLDQEGVTAARWDDGMSHMGESTSQMTLVAYLSGELRVVFRHKTAYDNAATQECNEDPTQCQSWRAAVATRFVSCEEPMELVVTTTGNPAVEGGPRRMVSIERYHLGPTGYASTERVEAPARPATAPAMAILPISITDLPPELAPCGMDAKGLHWSDATGEHRFVLCITSIADPDDDFDNRTQARGLLQDLAPQAGPPVEVFLDRFDATEDVPIPRTPELFDVDGDGQGEVFFEYQVFNSQGVDTARRALVLLEGKDRYTLNGRTELRDGCNHLGGDFDSTAAPEPFRTFLALEFYR